MINRKKRTAAFLLAAAMLICCSACGKNSEEDPLDQLLESSGGKDIVRAEAADNVFSLNSNSKYSLNPLIATNHANQLICCLVYENMVELDNNFNVIPNVITEWSCNDNATLWTFKIAEGHVFHDGTPVTSKDLRYSLDRAVTSDRYRGRFSSYQGASYVNDTELQVSLGIGDSQFVKLLNIPIIKSGTYGDERPLGSGPYMFNEDGTQLLAHTGYQSYETLPVPTIDIKEFPTAEGTITAFEDSTVDIVINDPSSYTNLGYASTNEIHTYATTNMHYVAFNEDSALGRLSYFRAAMQYAFDRAYLVELLNGNGVASAVPMYPTCDIYPQELADSLKFNLETCRVILDNAGIQDYDEDGMLEYMAGSPQEIEIKFVVCSDSSAKGGVANRFAQDMEELGLNVVVQELTWDNYMKALEDGDFDMYYGEVRLRNNFDLTELLQVRDEDEEDGNTGTNINYTNSIDSTAETLINSYLSAGSATRADAYQTLCDYVLRTTGSLVVIGFEKQQIISHRGVIKGIDANMGNPLYNFANWEIDLG